MTCLLVDLPLVDDSVLTISGGVGVEYPWTSFVGPRYFAGSLCYDFVSTRTCAVYHGFARLFVTVSAGDLSDFRRCLVFELEAVELELAGEMTGDESPPLDSEEHRRF